MTTTIPEDEAQTVEDPAPVADPTATDEPAAEELPPGVEFTPEPVPQETSALLKVHRVVNGDDKFRARVEAACWSLAVVYEEFLVPFVARGVIDAVSVDVLGTVDSNGVTDQQILDVLNTAAIEGSTTPSGK